MTTWLAVLLAALLTVACGQKGPLYLPEDGTPPAETAPAPASKGAAAQDTGG